MKKDEKSNDLITTRNTHSMEKNEKRWKKDMKKKAKKKKMEKINDTITTRNTHSIKNIWIKSHMLSNYILFKV